MNLSKYAQKKYLIAAAAACTALSSPLHAGGSAYVPVIKHETPVVAPVVKKTTPAPAVKVDTGVRSSLKKLFTPEESVSEEVAYEGGNSIEDAIMGGKAYVDARYRYEYVDQDGFNDEAKASTLRTKFGYNTGKWNDLSATLEFDNVAEIGDEEHSSATSPNISDDQKTLVNQAYVTYTGLADTVVRVGRQRAVLDNERFIGASSWRQNERTWDSVLLQNKSLTDVTATYVYVDNINNANGGNLDTGSHIINVAYDGLGFGKVVGYNYLLDVDAAPSLSSSTYGLRFTGSAALNDNLDALYTAEYAKQSDYADNTADYDANYYLGELGLACSKTGLTLKGGFESLGNDGANSFQTPLASGHGHNGWADKFGTIPANGLTDLYAKASYAVSGTDTLIDGLGLAAAYHIFEAENGGAEYGDEIDAQISKKIGDHYKVAVQYANYTADTFSTDTEKVSFIVGAKF